MRQLINSLLIIALLISFSHQVVGQRIKRLSLAVMNESVTLVIPSFSSLHPGVEAGIGIDLNTDRKHQNQINLHLGYYHHQHIANAFYLRADYVFQKKFNYLIGIDFSSGIGYMHTFNPSVIYVLNDSGEFEEITNFGRPHLIANFGFGISFLNNSSFEPFIRYKFMIETPFANGIPVIPHTFLLIGTNFKINHDENKK